MERALEGSDLILEQGDLGSMAPSLELRERVERPHVGNVELLQQAVDAVLGADDFLHEPEPRAHQIPGPALGGGDHVGRGDQVGPEQRASVSESS